jgi:hypothetical protein
MNALLRNTVSVILLFVYAASGLLIELAHHDEAALATPSEARVDHHDCGGTEQHPAPEASHCLACALTTQRVAIETEFSLPPQAASIVHARVQRSLGVILHADVLHSGKRGPPTVS